MVGVAVALAIAIAVGVSHENQKSDRQRDLINEMCSNGSVYATNCPSTPARN
jgi:hypothetical protein